MAICFVGIAQASGIEDYSPDSSQARLVTDKNEKMLILYELEQVDVPFEMGDGYYDFVSSELYSVKDEGKVIGYLELTKLSYTEDPIYVYVLVRFGADGKRVGDLEEYGTENRE